MDQWQRNLRKPYQSSSGVRLHFNYWVDNAYLLDDHISNAIENVLELKSPTFLDEKPGSGKIVVVAIHNLECDRLEKYLSAMPFLQSCSSMPIRHANTIIASTNGTRNTSSNPKDPFQYMEVDSMNSLILWPEKRYRTLEELQGMPLNHLFANYKLVFKVGYLFMMGALAYYR
jgi:hypothetical protein